MNAGQSEPSGEIVVSIQDVAAHPADVAGQYIVTLRTNHGDLEAVFVPCEGRPGCVVFVGDEGAQGAYRRVSEQLVADGVTSLRLRPRVPGEFSEGVIDVLAGCAFLKGLGGGSAVVVGHSYAGAVAIRSGTISPFVSAVAAIAPQRFGTQGVEAMAKPLLLIHGSEDQVLPPLASDDVYQRAQEPKRLVMVEGADHGFAGHGEELAALLYDYIVAVAGARGE
jgi:fermentation-respiration switch protein FrsA (DUF1100 family)